MRFGRPSSAVFVFVATAATLLTIACSPGANQATSGDLPQLAFEKFTLSNGLEVILSEDHRLPLVAVNLWYHVGPANEEPGRTGFAHLFEHMMFQGSKHVPGDAHFRLLEGAGASSLNGTTDYDRTNYFQTVPSNQLELALWLEADRMGYLLDEVDQAKLTNQQDVVRNERRQSVENAPYGIVDEQVTQLLFPSGHPYFANVIGSHADIQAVRLEDVKNFFKLYYSPNNASLAIVGDIDSGETKALVEKYFGTLKRGEPVPDLSVETPSITAERRAVVADRVELPRVYMAWITPPIYEPGDAEAEITSIALGGGRASRLYKSLVYEQQIAQDVRASQYSLTLGSMFQIRATARPGRTADELERAIDAVVASFRSTGPDQSEVDRARNTLETRIIQGLERLGGFGGVADLLNQYNHHLGDPGFLAADIQRYRDATPESVRDFAGRYLAPSARVVVHGVPGEPDLGPPINATDPAQIAEGGGAESVNEDEPWRNEPPQAGDARALEVPVPTAVELENGLTLIVAERPGLPIVSANLVLKTGSETNPLEKPGLASFTTAMLDEGTTSRTAPQIADEVAQLGGTLGAGSSMDATQVSIRSLTRTFPQMLDVLADVVRRPSFPAEEIDRQRSSRLASLVQQRESANAVVAVTMYRALYGPDHPYGYPELGTEDSNRQMTREDMHAFWRQNFVPNNAALVVSGQVTMDELRPLVEDAFGDWERGAITEHPLPEPTTTPARIVFVDKPDAPQTQLMVASIGVPRATPDYEPILVMNEVLGGLFSSRINLNLREEHGYTYGARSQFVFRRSAGPFVIATGVRTDVTGPSVTEIFNEIREIRQEGVTAEELALARDSIVRSLPAQFETSSRVTASTSNIFIYDLGLDYYARLPARLSAVTIEQVQAMAEKYVVPDNLIVIAVGDGARVSADLRALGLGAVEVRHADGTLVGP